MKMLTADFAGAQFPLGTKVSFRTQGDVDLKGIVERLMPRYAKVAAENGTLWEVPYRLLTVVKEAREAPEISLAEVQRLANSLLRKHKLKNGIGGGWRFGFDLAPSRAGVCNYRHKQISLSVTYCLEASREDVVDTVLHEIAHALVGPAHGHDAVWRAMAIRIGCSGDRCHTVNHTPPRWIGECECRGKLWERHRLTHTAKTGVCAQCENRITWLSV